MNYSQARQDQDDRRELEKESDQEHHGGEERHVGIEGDGIEDGVAHRIMHEKHEADRQDDEIAHGHSQVEKSGREAEGRADRFPFMLVKRGSDEFPDFPDHEGKAQHGTAQERDLQVHEKLGRKLRIDEVHPEVQPQEAIEDEIRLRRPQDGLEQVFRNEKEDERKQDDREH